MRRSVSVSGIAIRQLAIQRSFLPLFSARFFSINTKPLSKDKVLLAQDAIPLVIAGAAGRAFDESIDVAFNLGIEPRKPGHSIRGVISLPHGSGKRVRLAVFAKGDKATEALQAGADYVGMEDLAEKISKGFVDFERCIATPDAMGVVGRVARMLGPRGLMPNPKLGTVTADVVSAIKAAKQGQVEYRAEKEGIVHLSIGKASFPPSALLENLKAVSDVLLSVKPADSKGIYFRRISISSTMGRSYQLDPDRPPFNFTITRSSS
eukprot:TRINITY_DN5179_c0_g1_i1.p1 TRINITY_DN5179_c0_g1~~TRINITY_DN5179_c0_g1_i1.p1  ORF type:complete len:264 (+),score=73.10 TRINITY_DN5179_c0_g1_i1:376-1167(+)